MLSESQLRFVMTFRDQATAQAQRMGKSLEGVGASAGKAQNQLNAFGQAAHNTNSHVGHLSSGLGGLLGMFEAFVVGSVAHGAIETLAEFGQRMSTVGAITEATTGQMQQLRDQVLVLDVRTRFSATQVAEGARQLARAGLDINQIMQTLHSSLDLAAAGDIDVSQGTDIMTATLAAFRLQAADAARVADVLAYTSKHANTTVDALGESMKYVGATAGSMGLSLEQTAAALGALGRGGLRGSMAGTTLRQTLVSLRATTDHSRNALAQMHLSLDDVNVSTARVTVGVGENARVLTGFNAVLHNLITHGMSTNNPHAADLAIGLAGTRSATGLLILTQQAEQVQELSRAMERRPSDAIQNAISYIGQEAQGSTRDLEKLRSELVDLMDNRSQLFMQAATHGAGGLANLDETATLRDRLMALGSMSHEQMQEVFGPATRQIEYILSRFDDIKDRLTGSQADVDGMARDIAFQINNNLSGALERLHASIENFVLGIGQDTFGPVRDFIDNVALAIRMTTTSAYHLNEALRDIATQVRATTGMHPHQFDFLDSFQGTAADRITAGKGAMSPDELAHFNELVRGGKTELQALNQVADEAKSHLEQFDRAVADRTNTIMNLRAALVGVASVIGGALVLQVARLVLSLNPVLLLAGGLVAAWDRLKGTVEGTATVMAHANKSVDDLGKTVQFTLEDRMASGFDMAWEQAQKFLRHMHVDMPAFGVMMEGIFNNIALGLATLGPSLDRAGKLFHAWLMDLSGQHGAAEAERRMANATFWVQEHFAQQELDSRAGARARERARVAAEEARRQMAALAAAGGNVTGRTEADLAGEDVSEDGADEGKNQRHRDAHAQFLQQHAQRMNALTMSRLELERYNAATAMSITMDGELTKAQGESEEAFQRRAELVRQRREEITRLTAEEQQARLDQIVRQTNADTLATNERIRISHLFGEAQTEETAILDARIQKAQELGVALSTEIQLTEAETAAVRARAQAQYQLEHQQRSWIEGIKGSFQEWAQKARDIGTQAGDIFNQAIGGAVDNITNMLTGQEADWRNWGFTVMQMIAKVIVQLLVMQAVQKGMQMFGFNTGGVPGASGGLTPMTPMVPPITFNAKGNAFTNGIFNSPHLFRFGKGGSKLGMLGEAGEEGVFPLKRMSNGNLGVEGTMGGGGAVVFSPTVQVTVQGGQGGEMDHATGQKVAQLVSDVMETKFNEFQQRGMRSHNRLVSPMTIR